MWPILCSAGVFVLIGACIILVPIWAFGTHHQIRFFRTYNFHFMLWLVIVLGQFVLWGYLLPELLALARPKFQGSGTASSVPPFPPDCRRDLKITLGVFFIVIAGGAGLAIIAGPHAPFLPHYSIQIGATTLIGIVVAMVAGTGMWACGYQLRAILDTDGAGYGAAQVSRYLAIRTDLQFFLYALGLILTGGVLGAAASRQATFAFDPSKTFDITGVLLYGTYFTAVLAFAYLPVHATLLAVGKRIRDGTLPNMPNPRAADGSVNPAWSDWSAARSTLDDLMELGVSANASLQAGVLILSPLLGSLLTALFATQSTT
jgi:hypothetical protein